MHSEGGRAQGSRMPQGNQGAGISSCRAEMSPGEPLRHETRQRRLQAGAVLRHGLCSHLAYLERLHAIYL